MCILSRAVPTDVVPSKREADMKTPMIVGLVLVLAGITLFVLQAAGVFVDRAGVEIGDLEVGVEAANNPAWLPWVAGGSAALGAVLMLTSRR